jgi:hypothetical protein
MNSVISESSYNFCNLASACNSSSPIMSCNLFLSIFNPSLRFPSTFFNYILSSSDPISGCSTISFSLRSCFVLRDSSINYSMISSCRLSISSRVSGSSSWDSSPSSISISEGLSITVSWRIWSPEPEFPLLPEGILSILLNKMLP